MKKQMKTYMNPDLCRDQREYFEKRPMVILPRTDARSMFNRIYAHEQEEDNRGMKRLKGTVNGLICKAI